MKEDDLYATAHDKLLEAWNRAAEVLEVEPARPYRYAKCLRYIHEADRGARYLEVGCGEGTGLLLAESLGFRRLVGVEVSDKRLEMAKSKLDRRAELVVVAPDNRLPFATSSFDIAVSAGVIEHALDAEGFVREIARVVRPGGRVVISSDCWQWRVAAWLGGYQSAQPIDTAIFPTRLFRCFRRSGLRLQHYEGFPLPGREYVFLRLLAKAIKRRRLLRPAVDALEWRLQLYTDKMRRPLRGSPAPEEKRGLKPSVTPELLDRTIYGDWGKKPPTRAFLDLFLSDESVFFLVKPNGKTAPA